MHATIIFPHQLYKDHPAIRPGQPVVLFECDLYFTQYRFHKHKIILHRASMKSYEQRLLEQGHIVHYLEFNHASIEQLIIFCREKKFETLHFTDPVDYLATRRLMRYARIHSLMLKKYESPNFLCTTTYLDQHFGKRHHYRLTEFYIEQRKRFNILMDNDAPAGGKWTYDIENRKKLPSKEFIPPRPAPVVSGFVSEAQQYVTDHFKDNPGSEVNFNYPVDHAGAQASLKFFLANYLRQFGVYQDAIVNNNHLLFHSILTPTLNIGLLSPQEIVDEAISFSEAHNIPINSLEGFIRQIIGWREFIRAVYHRDGVKQRTSNFWRHEKPIPESFYSGNTGIKPVDETIHKVLEHSYTHHIERLMIMGNFMLLCEFHPDHVYRWFMELFIDAYDWVMVPNVYGMSQFADGGMMSTKPYISGSNYILKMSDYKKDSWSEIWDSLFWSFIENHYGFFSANPRLSMMTKQLEKMEAAKKRRLREVKDTFIREKL